MRFVFLYLLRFYCLGSEIFKTSVGLFGFRSECKFGVSCSEYAKDLLSDKKNSLAHCVKKISLRLLSCSPAHTLFHYSESRKESFRS